MLNTHLYSVFLTASALKINSGNTLPYGQQSTVSSQALQTTSWGNCSRYHQSSSAATHQGKHLWRHAEDTNSHWSLLLLLVRALVPCLHRAAWASLAGLWRSVRDCLAAAQQWWQPRCPHLISTLYLITLKVKINSNILDLHEQSWGQGEQSPLPSPLGQHSTNLGACPIPPNTGCLCAGLWKKSSNCYAR